ncbi:3-hydroxybutyryl-CoA dehydrogenase [Marinitoga sp. 1135]|uniref:3-hydroxyacyl-CoA dehydrogenase n=1 Tax=Marinitoga piezophila (strain DSM 14283 / JCM 11233 / KA3) TaxID=443254 RepID=H2J5A9_MARPK|nr:MULTISPECIES: 3-hydroxyacyl-CoA dehydrogenase [Marinitoga]AEX84967.1 3-hydroxyacyl-CoA dehydrogenase [Marinitoga piezophila KA3]APT75474.1 3-hydroxybutyryl-CoA dehydrogenase [Marinitoga sp. 1137]NUU95198.1 3-hydroxybutyryl-CoA dehydrogenase [Marinitoga sp. 1135]NUU97130.1 3-hydroxybutyryl-CoA dehydrogenase [Marinitoga sp. 1138]
MDIKNVTIIGGGVLGSQIAWQVAYKGFDVIVYDINEDALEKSKNFHKGYAQYFLKNKGATSEEIEATFSRLKYTTDLNEAVKEADLISESVPEVYEIKKDIYQKLAAVAPEKTIFTTNSSTMLPSQLVNFTGRPEKFLALHFANPVWEANIGEVMGHEKTSKEVFDTVVEFAKAIGMVPIPLKKEQSGYVLNSLLVPLLHAAETLYFDGVADYKSIDKTWMISTGSKFGPFGIIDLIGMNTLYNIIKMRGEKLQDEKILKRAEKIKEMFIDKNKLGVSTGEGFYKYPNPEYLDPEFLK